MAIDLEYYRQRLQQKEADLVREITRSENDARDPADAEVQDSMDRVTTDEAKAGSLEYASREQETLNLVRAALDRINDGTYGECLDCGEPIEPKRLEAVPWAEYCLKDQEKRDAEAGITREGLTL